MSEYRDMNDEIVALKAEVASLRELVKEMVGALKPFENPKWGPLLKQEPWDKIKEVLVKAKESGYGV